MGDFLLNLPLLCFRSLSHCGTTCQKLYKGQLCLFKQRLFLWLHFISNQFRISKFLVIRQDEHHLFNFCFILQTVYLKCFNWEKKMSSLGPAELKHAHFCLAGTILCNPFLTYLHIGSLKTLSVGHSIACQRHVY